jgi:hypothetical protein
MHIQASQNSRAAQRGRLFIMIFSFIFLNTINANAYPVRCNRAKGQGENRPQAVGAMLPDEPANKIPPVLLNIQEACPWEVFTGMLSLGLQHVKAGTDHLLFLLTLLLPATLVVNRKEWGQFGGVGYSLVRIFKIVTAFTVGHAISLFIGATGFIHFPGRALEVLLALSIFVSAVHTCKPVFAGKELYIAGGFGFIHGMAFAATLINLRPHAGRMALSILGFNLGIELMQLFIIAIIVPWLFILSYNNLYKGLRIAVAAVAAVASIGWMAERITGKPNVIGSVIMLAPGYATWLLVGLIVAAIMSFFVPRKQNAVCL